MHVAVSESSASASMSCLQVATSKASMLHLANAHAAAPPHQEPAARQLPAEHSADLPYKHHRGSFPLMQMRPSHSAV